MSQSLRFTSKFLISVISLAACAMSPIWAAPAAGPASQKTQSVVQNRPVSDKWALIVGISKFTHPEYNLRYASKDALDFYNFLIKDCKFSPDHVKILLDEDATRANIMSAFGTSWLPKVCMPDDLAVIYISTHGTPSSRDAGKKNFIVAHDTDREELFGTGVNMNDLCTQIKERVKTDRLLLVMDTCYSGGAASGAKGAEQAANFDANALALGSGRLVITSSTADQRSWESKNYENGIFTHHLIDALKQKNGTVSLSEAFGRLKKNVAWEAQSSCGADQLPVLGGKWEGKDLVLAVAPTEPRMVPAALVPTKPVDRTSLPAVKSAQSSSILQPANDTRPNLLTTTSAAGAHVGKPAPIFSLPDTTGKPRSLVDFAGKFVVLEWVNFDCPFVRKQYNSKDMQKLQNNSAAKGVQWLSICSSAPGRQGNYPPEKVTELMKQNGATPTAYLFDPDGKVGKLYGATSTPHMYIISPKGMLIYAGAIDDHPSADISDRASTNFVQKALDEAIAGKPVSNPTTRAYGCSIKYQR